MLREHVKPKHLDALTEARHRRFDGLQTDLEWMTKLDSPERTATIKPVFSQNEIVVDVDYCIIAPGATSVPFTSGASHCSELANSVLDVVRKTGGSKCFQEFLLYHSLLGGTGSGMGTLLTSKCAKNTPIVSWKHSPSSCQHAVFEPYNAVLISMSSKRIRINTCCWRTEPYTTSVSAY